MDKYFKFPIALMQKIKDGDTNKALLRIAAFSLMDFSEKMTVNKSSVANQIIYLYYRKPGDLTKKIRRHIDDMIEDGRMIEDEDYHGFGGDTFTPEQEHEGMTAEFNSNNAFYLQCVALYKELQALSLLNLNQSLRPNFQELNKEARVFINEYEGIHGPDAWTSISNKLLFDAFSQEADVDHFRLVAAVKSVVGKRNFNDTYKAVLLCRMFGCKKQSILNSLFEADPDLRAKHEFLSRRRQWEKLIDTAEDKGYFTYYSTGRQFFVSITMTKNELRHAVENKRVTRITA
jgi:hypothetical protein